MACAVGIVRGLAAQEEAVEPLVSADRMDLRGPPSEHLVDVALVGNVEHELVLRRGENPVHRHGQLDDAEVRPEMAAGFRQPVDQCVADLIGELGQVLVAEFLDVAG